MSDDGQFASSYRSRKRHLPFDSSRNNKSANKGTGKNANLTYGRIPDDISMFIHRLWYTDQHINLIFGPKDAVSREELASLRANILRLTNQKLKDEHEEMAISDIQLLNHIMNKRKNIRSKINQGFTKKDFLGVDLVIYNALQRWPLTGTSTSATIYTALIDNDMQMHNSQPEINELRGVEKFEPIDNPEEEYKMASGSGTGHDYEGRATATATATAFEWTEQRSIEQTMEQSLNGYLNELNDLSSSPSEPTRLEEMSKRIEQIEASMNLMHKKLDKILEFVTKKQAEAPVRPPDYKKRKLEPNDNGSGEQPNNYYDRRVFF